MDSGCQAILLSRKHSRFDHEPISVREFQQPKAKGIGEKE
jgi:hypothetical protein